jgi:hypothetical protein
LASVQGSRKKKKRGKRDDDLNGMTQEEMIAEQKRLFDDAKNYNYDEDDEEGYYDE